MWTHGLEVDMSIDVWDVPVFSNDSITIDSKRRRVSTAVPGHHRVLYCLRGKANLTYKQVRNLFSTA